MARRDSDARPERSRAEAEVGTSAPGETERAGAGASDGDRAQADPVQADPVQADPVQGETDGPVEVRRSSRRRRTVTAYRDGEKTVVLIPARMSRTEERRWVAQMLERLERQEQRRRPSNAALLARARELCRQYLDARVEPSSVRWVTNQGHRWGSCTVADRSIRLSHRLRGMPAWVVDYVLLHECAHLVEPGHTKEFWALVRRFPRADRARGYLEGVSATAGLELSDEADE
jgi:predicted metal-dependent hydrolase